MGHKELLLNMLRDICFSLRVLIRIRPGFIGFEICDWLLSSFDRFRVTSYYDLKGVQRPAAFAIVFSVFVNFVQSAILEAVESMSLTSHKECWSLYSL